MKNWTQMDAGAFGGTPTPLPLGLDDGPGQLDGMLPIGPGPEVGAAADLPIALRMAAEILSRQTPQDTGRGEVHFYVGELRGTLRLLANAAADLTGAQL